MPKDMRVVPSREVSATGMGVSRRRDPWRGRRYIMQDSKVKGGPRNPVSRTGATANSRNGARSIADNTPPRTIAARP